jgi:hypothetical protein
VIGPHPAQRPPGAVRADFQNGHPRAAQILEDDRVILPRPLRTLIAPRAPITIARAPITSRGSTGSTGSRWQADPAQAARR